MEIRGEDHRRRLGAMGHRGRRPLPRRREDRLILLDALARRFSAGEEWTERRVTEAIQDWLLGPARFLECDAVTLRRALIDEGFLERDPAGTRYEPSQKYTRWIRFLDPPQDPDCWLRGESDTMLTSESPA